MTQLYQLDESLAFPHPDYALNDPNGLLAFGGDLSVERLRLAYRNGIFPWFSDQEPIMWWSPDPRGVLELDQLHVSKSLKKCIRQKKWRVTINKAFTEVSQACSTVPRSDDGTWITESMLNAYTVLHRAGIAHSVEVWDQDNLIGGLYGVSVGKVFCGESMFHRQTNGSKLAFYYLVEHLRQHNFDFIDCQMQNPHLATLGVTEISRDQYLQRLLAGRDKVASPDVWRATELVL